MKIAIASRGWGIEQNRCRGVKSEVGERFWEPHLDDPMRHFRENRLQNFKIAIMSKGLGMEENRGRAL